MPVLKENIVIRSASVLLPKCQIVLTDSTVNLELPSTSPLMVALLVTLARLGTIVKLAYK